MKNENNLPTDGASLLHKKKKINVYRFGSCRTNYLREKDDINTNDVTRNYTHSTKDVIQQIKMLNNEINIEECKYPKCFTTYISESENYKRMYNDADVILIEDGSIDSNHLTEYAYDELYKNFIKILKENNLY